MRQQLQDRVIREETAQQEHDRLRAQRERIARLYGHQPKAAVPVGKPAVSVTEAAHV